MCNYPCQISVAWTAKVRQTGPHCKQVLSSIFRFPRILECWPEGRGFGHYTAAVAFRWRWNTGNTGTLMKPRCSKFPEPFTVRRAPITSWFWDVKPQKLSRSSPDRFVASSQDLGCVLKVNIFYLPRLGITCRLPHEKFCFSREERQLLTFALYHRSYSRGLPRSGLQQPFISSCWT